MSETPAPSNDQPIVIEQILDILPHRYPFLLIDRVLEIVPRLTCTGYKNVTINEPFFVGHYPGRPIMPGVLILEAMAQVGCALILADEENKGKIPLLVAMENIRFLKPVVPGDQLVTSVEQVWMRKEMGRFRGVAKVDGQPVAQAEVVYKLVTREF